MVRAKRPAQCVNRFGILMVEDLIVHAALSRWKASEKDGLTNGAMNEARHIASPPEALLLAPLRKNPHIRQQKKPPDFSKEAVRN
jgi:hypothetical protein